MKISRVKLVITSTVTVCLIAGIIFVIKINNEPAEGVIHQVKPGPERNTGKKVAATTFDGKYVQFNYPSSYRKIALPKNANLETINLLGNATNGGEITVSITSGSLAENSALRLRRLQKETYTEQALNLPNISGVVFTKTQSSSFEKTAIVERNGMVASIAISSSVGKDLSDTFDLVTKSFLWK